MAKSSRAISLLSKWVALERRPRAGEDRGVRAALIVAAAGPAAEAARVEALAADVAPGVVRIAAGRGGNDGHQGPVDTGGPRQDPIPQADTDRLANQPSVVRHESTVSVGWDLKITDCSAARIVSVCAARACCHFRALAALWIVCSVHEARTLRRVGNAYSPSANRMSRYTPCTRRVCGY